MQDFFKLGGEGGGDGDIFVCIYIYCCQKIFFNFFFFFFWRGGWGAWGGVTKKLLCKFMVYNTVQYRRLHYTVFSELLQLNCSF